VENVGCELDENISFPHLEESHQRLWRDIRNFDTLGTVEYEGDDEGDDYTKEIEPKKEEDIDETDFRKVSAPTSRKWLLVKLLLAGIFGSLWLLLALYCYLFISTVCFSVELWCPSPTITFPASVCCSALWLWLGAPLGLGNECTVDMSDMLSGCPDYDCYTNATTGELNVNGCSYVPDTLFNRAACDIHDLCYVTPGATKEGCDRTFVENIILIYCDNVPVVERVACRVRAQVAGAAVAGFDSFFDAEAETRATCREKSKYLSPIIVGLVVTLLAFVAMLVAVVKMRKRTMVVVEVEEEYSLPPVIEEEEEEEEPVPCYCEVPMENCIVCDEAFAKDLGRQCDILEVEKDNEDEEEAGCEVPEKKLAPCERKKSKELEGIEEVLEAIDQKLGDIDQRFEGINLELEGLDQELEGESQKEEESAHDEARSFQKKDT